MGDLQVEIFRRYLGSFSSRYLTHAGQQLVNMGKGPPVLRRWRNSSASEMVVMSAPKLVSYTSSAPMIFRAGTILSMMLTPAGMPKSSPSATRTAGAICTTTRFWGSWSARHAVPIWSLTVIAPVVQTAAHWPQPTHFVSSSFRSKAGMTCSSLPRKAKFRMPCPCSSSHTRTQSPQRMHLLGSRNTA